MRILLIHQYFLEKNDGGGSRWNEMAKMWAAEGHEITVLAGMVHYASGKKNERYKGKYFFSEEFEPGIQVVRCHVSEAYNVNFIGRLWAYFSFVFSSIYAGIFKIRGKYDIILVTSPPLFVGITAYVLSRLKRVPYLLEIRDLWPESAIDTGVLKNTQIIRLAYWVEAFLYKKAAKINVLTPAFREKLIIEKHVPAEKILYIPNAADFGLSDHLLHNYDVNEFRKSKGLEGRFVITYVGAHGIANHLVQVLDAATHLKEIHPEVLFLLIGEGMEKPWLKQKAEKRGLFDMNVRFIDAVPKSDVFKFILASDLGASILKKNDTFKTVYSNKTFDYMACKKPVLMLIDGVSRELVENASCGRYVPPEDTAAFVEAVKHYLRLGKTNLLTEGERGYQFAKANFDRQVLAKRYLSAVSGVKRYN
jgi:glycosyltransferase involved in cell wall biosynthesis